jgi:hypothetical protein
MHTKEITNTVLGRLLQDVNLLKKRKRMIVNVMYASLMEVSCLRCRVPLAGTAYHNRNTLSFLTTVEQTEDFEGVVCCDTCDKVIHERCLGRWFGIKEDAEALPDPWSCPFCQGMAIEPKQQKRKERTTPARKGAPNTTPFAKANKVTPMKQTERAANRDRPPAWANSSATTPITTVKRPTLLGTLEISQKKQKVGEASKVAAASVSTIETEQAANRVNGDMVEEDKSVQQQLKDNHEEIQLLKNVIKEKNSELNDKNDWIETKEDELAKKNEELAKKDSELAKKDEKISRLKEAIHRLTSAL